MSGQPAVVAAVALSASLRRRSCSRVCLVKNRIGRPVKLWNDYEGKMIAETYPLKKLLRPEGRSAFFATSDEDGAPDVIRITESLNDEHEMLERWRQVSEAHQPNLVEIKTFGATTFDGVPLTYALMEATDGSLAEILQERPLTEAETMQVATSVVAALAALHAIGLIHEHIEPASIVATGEVVKLRSDCVRECLVDPEFNPQSTCDELRRRDVHDLAVLLLQCLTLERQWTSAMRLPASFEPVIRHGLDGTWGLAEMERALHAPAETGPGFAGGQDAPEPVSALNVLEVRDPTPSQRAAPSMPQATRESPAEPEVRTGTRRLHLRRLIPSPASQDLVPKRWLLAGAVAFVLVLLAWFFRTRTSLPVPAGATAASEATPPAAKDASAAGSGENAATAKPSGSLKTGTVPQPGWHVIAYTYLHEGQAAAKAATIARLHPGLRDELV